MNVLVEKYLGKKIDCLDVVNIVEAARILSGKECVVVTGVTGQDGSHMVDYLIENTNYHVVGCVRRLSLVGEIRVDNKDSDRFKLVFFDLSDSNMISLMFEKLKPAFFINLAAQSFVGSSWDFAFKTWDINSTAVLNILESIRLYHPKCRFFQAGSSEEFGEVVFTPQNEGHPLRPKSPYGASKVAARHLVSVWRESYGLFAVQGWLYNHEGPRRGEEFVTRKITKSVARIRKAINDNCLFAELELGNIHSTRDWSYAEDVVKGIWLMVNNTSPNDFVLASGEVHSIKEFVQIAFECAGLEGKWLGNGLEEVFQSVDSGRILVRINPKFYRPLEVGALVGDSSRARTILGWQPSVSFHQMVDKMVEFDLKRVGL